LALPPVFPIDQGPSALAQVNWATPSNPATRGPRASRDACGELGSDGVDLLL